MTPAAETMSRARRWGATLVLSASLLVITMDMTILVLALPEIAADVNPTATQQLWIIDAYSLVLAGLLFSAAALADRWGRRRMLLIGYGVFMAASLLILIAPSAGSIIAIRVFLGMGGAFIMPTTLSLIRVIFTDPTERAKALGVWAAVSGLGAAVGPLVGGLLLQHFSWHSAFLVNVPLMLLGIVAGLALLPESRVPNPGRWDVTAAALSLIGMTALIWAIKKFGNHSSLAVPSAWLALAGAVVALGLFVRRCQTSSEPLLDIRLFRNRALSAGVIAALGSTFAIMAALLLIAQWLQAVHGSSPIQSGLWLMPMAIGSAASALVAPPLAQRTSARAVLVGGLVLAGLGMALLVIDGGSIAIIVASVTIVGLGTGSLAIGSAMIMSGSPEEKAGNAGALEETAYELGATLGVAVLGSISAIVYRSRLTGDAAYAALADAAPEAAGHVRESLGAAVAIADSLELPAVASAAGRAFEYSLQLTGLIGGISLIIVAVVIGLIAPRGWSLRDTA